MKMASISNRMSKKSVDQIESPHLLGRRHMSALFACTYCLKKFRDKNNLVYHEQIHQWNRHVKIDDDKPFKCESCDEKFADKVGRDEHSQIHWKRYVQKCGWCSKKFAIKQHLRCHERIHTWIDSMALHRPFDCNESKLIFQSVEDDEVINDNGSLCDLGCSSIPSTCHTAINNNITDDRNEITTKRKSTVNLKKRSHSPIAIIQPKFDCFECKQRFNSKEILQRHKMIHSCHAHFQCDHCNMIFDEIEKKLEHECLVHCQAKVVLTPIENTVFLRLGEERQDQMDETFQEKTIELSDTNATMEPIAIISLCSYSSDAIESMVVVQTTSYKEKNTEKMKNGAQASNGNGSKVDAENAHLEKFLSEKNLHIHKTANNEQFKCNYCDMTFDQLTIKLQHECLNHTKPKVLLRSIDNVNTLPTLTVSDIQSAEMANQLKNDNELELENILIEKHTQAKTTINLKKRSRSPTHSKLDSLECKRNFAIKENLHIHKKTHSADGNSITILNQIRTKPKAFRAIENEDRMDN